MEEERLTVVGITSFRKRILKFLKGTTITIGIGSFLFAIADILSALDGKGFARDVPALDYLISILVADVGACSYALTREIDNEINEKEEKINTL